MSGTTAGGLGGFLAARRQRKHERRVLKEARLLLAEVRAGLARSEQGALPAAVRAELEADAKALERALATEDAAGIRNSLGTLEDKADRHLGFARKSTLREYAESIAIAVMFALLLRAFVVEAFKIPSGSMIPTLEVGDHIFVNKYIYGVRIPWTRTRFFTWRKPHRGEIIVFMYPVDPNTDFIKRVVAVAGDRLEVRNNQLVINGVPQERTLVDDENCRFDDRDKRTGGWAYGKRCILYREQIDDHVFYTIDLPAPEHPDHRDFPADNSDAFLADVRQGNVVVVPEGQVYVMGDNRDDSHDSRYWGGVPLENIKGEALIVWWSMGKSVTLGRLGRIGRLIY